MNTPHLAPDEPLSPELVLVMSPELRAQALVRLGEPIWPEPQRQLREGLARNQKQHEPSLGALLLARTLQLALIFVAVTAVTLAMALVAHAVR